MKSDEENIYPPLWNMAPSSLSDFPLINESLSHYRLIDPWYYPHRLGLYKILINVTTPFMPFCSSSNASNILFALPSQLGWLYRSNRLFTNKTMNISTSSWWGSANYYLSVIPFLVAMDAGLIAKEPFRIIKYENFCSNSLECFYQNSMPMIEWYRFFLQLQQSTMCIENKTMDKRLLDRCYLKTVWSAYNSSINHGLPLVESKLKYLPSDTERLFGFSWAKLINLIAMTRKNTNLYETIKNQRKFLPFRMLKDTDRTPHTNDLPDLVNRSLQVLFSFRFDWLLFVEKIWKKITCNFEGRTYAQLTLDTMGQSKIVALNYLVKAAINSFFYKCD